LLAWVLRKNRLLWYNECMRRIAQPWWLALIALLALPVGVRAWHHFHRPHLLHAGDSLTPLRLSALPGGTFVLRPGGRPQLINVFATWCPPCRMETPQFAAVAQRLQAHGVQVVGIDQQEGAAAVRAFARDFNVSYPLFIDTSGITQAVVGARIIPTTVFVGADGRIKWIHSGPMTGDELTALVKESDRSV
jgi:thiol-disulfide isomerase/thioredoxin